MFLDPGIGMFNGELHIDWITFGDPLPVSVIDYETVSTAMIYPNPAKGQLYLEMNTLSSGLLSSTIMDATGKLVQRDNLGYQTSGLSTSSLDVSNLGTGLYMLHVQLDGRPAFYSKLIID